MAGTQGAISKRRKFVADGVFYAELNEFFQRELAEEGYSGVEVRVTPTVTDISRSSIKGFLFSQGSWRKMDLPMTCSIEMLSALGSDGKRETKAECSNCASIRVGIEEMGLLIN
jgi:hypothetical protein